ncbi:MAG: phosphonate ABC transporter substrate-binding protein [Erysipelotrichaceae bacterium]|nr:phosphonate ABC transporter substrate-binding protein [Erysipelotrichaceae bacterium]MBR2545326.1 PhnD/SsuA/transferrin family substrate-binding protein [Erysipelotrichaceae bacterium]MBR2701083.1 PhnD/SsuA/transferrin family substrate-binding protein [Erysipelotrichaceae bacterium]
MKKLFVALLAVLLLVGCTPKEDDHKKFDVLHLQFVPSRPAEEILTGTSELGDLIIAGMKEKGYDIGSVEVTVSSSYEAAGEALASGAIEVAWLPGGTYAQFSIDHEVDVMLTATRDGLSNDSENPADWNGLANKTLRNGPPVTYYRGLIYAGPSEYGKKLAAKVNAGEKLTWDDVNGARWGFANVTSSAGYLYPTLWLMENFDGKKITDLKTVTELTYAAMFQQGAAEQIDCWVCYADGRDGYENNEKGSDWIKDFGRPDSIWNEVNVIGVTPGIYNDTVAATNANDKVDAAFKEAFSDVIIDIIGTEKGKEIFGVYQHSGYQKAKDADYEPSRQAYKLGLEN